MTSLSNVLCMRRGVKTLGLLMENPCVEVCTMFEEIVKCVEGNHGGTHT
jgi:hypothetical protein